MKLFSYLRAGALVATALLAALSGSPTILAAQAGIGAAPSSTALQTMAQGAEDAPDEPGQADAGAPVLPMSMRPFYHVFAAFGLAWLLIFGYAVSLRRRITSLEREVDLLDS